MRHEAEIKSNAYWLGLLAHLQASSVPRKVELMCLYFSSLAPMLSPWKQSEDYTWWFYNVLQLSSSLDVSHVSSLLTVGQDLSCIKDLTSLYEAATIDDVYIAYDQLKVDADSLYTCIGIAGAQAGEESVGEDFSYFSISSWLLIDRTFV